eukprot:TRINITY_DN5200_c0_g1_i3.p1 TRINITY_DN5200_c0_g1~~TRINITY_DN5200_c0_g1_i3.p1  ORF type:complete len:801 (-),score=138.84 TRINITY_DN5200_c0_g1_i3:206-2608(-)
MGVKGLSAYLKHRRHLLEPISLAEEAKKKGGKATIVLDGMNVVFTFFQVLNNPGDVLGDVIQTEKLLLNFLIQLQEIGIEAHIFFDGVPDLSKKSTIDQRKQDRITKVARFVDCIRNGTYPTFSPNIPLNLKFSFISAFYLYGETRPVRIDGCDPELVYNTTYPTFSPNIPLNLKFSFISAFYLYGETRPVRIDGCDPELVYNTYGLKKPSPNSFEVTHTLVSSQDEADSNMARYASSLPGCIGILSNDTDFIIFPNPGLIFADFFTRSMIVNLGAGDTFIYRSNSVALEMGINSDHFPLLGLLTGNDIFDPYAEIYPYVAKGWFPCGSIDAVLQFLRPHTEKSIEEICKLISIAASKPELYDRMMDCLRVGYEAAEVDFREITKESGIPRAEDQTGFWNSHFAALLGTTSLSLVVIKEVGWPNVIEDFEYKSPFDIADELDRLTYNVLFGHLQEKPTIRCDARKGKVPVVIMRNLQQDLQDMAYIPPIWNPADANDVHKISLLLKMTSFDTPVVSTMVDLEFAPMVLVLRWLTKHAEDFQLSERELDSLILSALTLAYDLWDDIRVYNPGLSVRAIQVASLYNAAISKMTLLCLMYGLPGGWKSIIMSRQFDASVFYTWLQEEYQQTAHQLLYNPQCPPKLWQNPVGMFLSQELDVGDGCFVALSSIFIAWKHAVLDSNQFKFSQGTKYQMVYHPRVAQPPHQPNRQTHHPHPHYFAASQSVPSPNQQIPMRSWPLSYCSPPLQAAPLYMMGTPPIHRNIPSRINQGYYPAPIHPTRSDASNPSQHIHPQDMTRTGRYL